MNCHEWQAFGFEIRSFEQILYTVEGRQAQIWLIAAVRQNGICERDARNLGIHLLARGRHYALHQWLNHFVDLFFLRERHFQIDLRELRLAVSPQIFVAETAHNLEIAFVTAHHQQLLKDLR